MPNYHRSYWKTTLAAGIAGVLVLVVPFAIAPAGGVWRGVVIVIGTLASLPSLAVAASGFMVLHRDATVAKGRRDLFHTWNQTRSAAAFTAGTHDLGMRLRQIVRSIVAPNLLVVGDEVEIRSFDEIRRTLDDADSLDGLPFMPEMVAFCGQRARVFRRVDKIYDYGGKKVLRRLKNTVLLHQMRCDGGAHGGCQADCYLMWKEAWLKRAPRKAQLSASTMNRQATAEPRPMTPQVAAAVMLNSQGSVAADGVVTYRCQFTQLVAASTPINDWDPRLDLRPLAAGNVTIAAFVVAMLTRLFNYVQATRGGYPFPLMDCLPPSTAPVTRTLVEGEIERVRPAQQIFQTLDKNFRNRGLWFDRDMVKHCGRDYQVLKRVDRIIDDATGRLRTMKTPCIVLKDVTYSGEFLRFLAQEEHLYWRDTWLSPKTADLAMPDQVRSQQ